MDSDLHQKAMAAGATVLGEDGTRQQYLMDLDQLATLARAVRVAQMAALVKAKQNALPPCPVPLPKIVVA